MAISWKIPSVAAIYLIVLLMHPILFELFGIKIYTFGVLVALAFVLGFSWICLRARNAREDVGLYLDAACWIIISALVGARLAYVVFFPDEFWEDPLGTLFSNGGLVWYGGMLGVTLAIIIFTTWKRLSLWKFSDIIIPPAALGLAIGRIGCLMAGCCYGGPCTTWWAVHYPLDHPTHGAGVYPAPLMESMAMFIAAPVLAKIYQHQSFQGQTTWMFFIIYGLVRFGLEYLRGDRLVWIPELNLSASQVISLCGIVLGVVMLIILKGTSSGGTRTGGSRKTLSFP